MSSVELRRMKKRMEDTKVKREAVYKFLIVLYYYSIYNQLLTYQERRRISSNILGLILNGTISVNFSGLSIPFNL